MQIAQSITNPYQYHYSLHPRIYVAPYSRQSSSSSASSPSIDGDINKPFWSSIPWSSHFDDIRGPIDAPPNERPDSNCTTKFKLSYDDEYLYILALITSDFDVTATYTERNSPIFQQDSDFEVFLDPMGSCHYYKELEVNALNTVWNLMLDKPYRDGGCEHSGRIAKDDGHDEKYYDVCLQKTAVRIIEGSINNHNQTDDDDHHDYHDHDGDRPKKNVWAVEMALSHQDTFKHIMKKCSNDSNDSNISEHPATTFNPPKGGDMWRINFSRVEKKGNINWTWQEQRVWDAKLHKHVGKVEMHLPDIWGYVRFGPKKTKTATTFTADQNAGEIPMEDIHNGKYGDPLWPLKLAVANVYYAQTAYKDGDTQNKNKYAKSMDELEGLLDENVMSAFSQSVMELKTSDDGTMFKFQIKDDVGNIVSITNDRYIKVQRSNDGNDFKTKVDEITEES